MGLETEIPTTSTETPSATHSTESVLGVDPETPAVETAAPVAETKPAETPAVDAATLEKARYYDLITSDAKLTQMISDHIKATNGQANPQPAAPSAPGGQGGGGQSPEIQAAVEAALRPVHEALATMRVQEFQRAHPDFENHRHEMASLLNRHSNMTMDEAYTIAKHIKGATASNGASTQKRPAAGVEGRGAGDVSEQDDYEQMMRRINDPKATPSMDRALELAFNAAMKKHESS